MSTSRADSQQPQYGRRRSNTAQSILRPPPLPTIPLKFGDSTILNAWVHDTKESSAVILNPNYWYGVAEGDLLSVSAGVENSAEAFIFVVPKDDTNLKPQLQISVPKPIAEAFGLRNNSEVTVIKVDKQKYAAEYVELSFQDQYLGRNDMWRMGKHLVNQCIYAEQEISFIGSIVAKIKDIYIKGQKVPAALMTSHTRIVYRSLSAKVTIFIQVCRELWEFAGDGERYNEKVVHSFLPALFSKWKEAGTNHTVTIVLISRVYYDTSEIKYAAGPLRRDERGDWYKDFYKVITDLEVIHEWKPTLVSLKNSFWDFQRDILLTHHYHRSSLDTSAGGEAEHVRLVGRLSYAHDGPILEALNLNLYPSETHYIDRSLVLTGTTTILITPGTGYFRVSKQLLRLTTNRMLDQGFGLDLVSLTKAPLHQSPIFSFQGNEPEVRTEKDNGYGVRAMDPLWGGDDEPTGEKIAFWWEPFWVSMSFWDEQVDLPFRQDRFVARAKMHEIQMLGLLEHDVLATIDVPFLNRFTHSTMVHSNALPTKTEANAFDLDIFALKAESKSLAATQRPTAEISEKSLDNKSTSQRTSTMTLINTIEESPRPSSRVLPDNDNAYTTSPSILKIPLNSSPTRSTSSRRSVRSSTSSMRRIQIEDNSPSRSTLASKFTPSWIFKPFRSGPVEPQITTESASASVTSLSTGSASSPSTAALSASVSSPPNRVTKPSSLPLSKVTIVQATAGSSPVTATPMAIKSTTFRNGTSRVLDEETPHLNATRNSLWRRSPLNTPPREEHTFGKRRSVVGSFTTGPFSSSSSSSPSSRPNPFQPQTTLSYSQASLAARWEHIFPVPLSKHDIKWGSIVTPFCLPLTVEYFPSSTELETSYDVFSYDFVVDPPEMRSFLVLPPNNKKGSSEERRRAWALVVMRGMAAVRLAQGFQFVIQLPKSAVNRTYVPVVAFRRTQSFLNADEEMTPKPMGAAEVLQNTNDPVYLSMSNEIHRISYTGEAIQVRRYVRRMPSAQPFDYQCLIWPKLGVGYTEHKTTFTPHGLENDGYKSKSTSYGWNRLDMLVAGYEHQFDESLRYWRTRFIIIPTSESPSLKTGPSGETLNDEEARILGIDKLAETFTKLRWQSTEEKEKGGSLHPPTRFLPTTLSPAMSVLDEALMDQLDAIHAAGPLRKKMKSEREISDMTLTAIAKAMREEDGVLIKHNQWHKSQYPDSFTGFDFVSWLVREFRDVSSRAQGAEWGSKLQEQGLLEHVRGHHNFLDGHYFYRLKGEYQLSSTPRRWFRTRTEDVIPRGHYPGNSARTSNSPRRNKKRLILSQSMVIDIDPNKWSDQAETVLLHHDLIHNPGTVFHFEIQWIGTTPRYIEDQLRQWSRTIEKYGLKLVEAYVAQIGDIRSRNAFQSCFPIRLAVAPPILAEIPDHLPEGSSSTRYFEYALLQNFGFIVDVEAADLYPESVDVIYSYRRSPFKYSQFVHRTGVAFVQVLGGSQGFLFLTNRLMGPGRMGTTSKSKEHRPAVEAERIRAEMHKFCSDKDLLVKFYDEELSKLGHVPEEPPPLRI
ncbi:hypothetical protein J3R30DRAFT_940415 [Lentinula aciculospora]|uniref:Vacuolar membrane-associated protein IML1 n=1 Tax=Lentinula aciculospora TaxID=153920 RepID=A0A9W9AQM5_9AGAR|nr:hypothetical protein J3R30DRAFT_940415 [Lentinula aciculospora]